MKTIVERNERKRERERESGIGEPFSVQQLKISLGNSTLIGITYVNLNSIGIDDFDENPGVYRVLSFPSAGKCLFIYTVTPRA